MPDEAKPRLVVRESGPAALRANIGACVGLAEVLSGTLGPHGSDKLLRDDNGDTLVTNDGATILEALRIEHPAGRLMTQLALAQDRTVGDGTTSVVLIAAELLRGAEKYLRSGGAPIQLARGLTRACALAVGWVDQLAVPVGSLAQVAATSCRSKVVDTAADRFAELVAMAVETLPATAGPADVAVVKRLGGTLAQSELVPAGVLIERPASPGGPEKLEDARVLVCHAGAGSGAAVWQRVPLADRPPEPNLAELLERLGATVVVCHGGLGSAVPGLGKAGVLCVEHAGWDGCQLAAQATGASMVRDLAAADRSSLGWAGQVRAVAVAGERMVELSRCKAPSRCSLVLRAPTTDLLHECGRAVFDALSVVCAARQDRTVVPAAGAIELELSARLRREAVGVHTADRHGLCMLADALEMIPSVVARNAGLDAPTLVAQAAALHSCGEASEAIGVDVLEARVRDVLQEEPVVVAPARLTKSVLKLACSVAKQILNIDENVLMPPRENFVIK